jgi:DNA-binding XRE family transcriptional regulator
MSTPSIYKSLLSYGPETQPQKVGKQTDREKSKHIFNETISLEDEIVFKSNIRTFTKIMKRFDKGKKIDQSHEGIIDKIKKNRKKLTKDCKELKKYQGKLEDAQEKTKKKRLGEKIEAIEEKIFKSAILSTLLKDDTMVNVVYLVNAEKQISWMTPQGRSAKYEPVIKEHLLRRIEHFFLQLVTCFETGFHFEVGETQTQGFSAVKLEYNLNGMTALICKRNAAHSSTFPNLKAYPSKDWEKHKTTKREPPKSIDFLKSSDMYKRMNSTIAMPIGINQVDILIDGNRHDSDFSIKALGLLNKVSKKEITITEGLTHYITALKKKINTTVKKEKDIEKSLCLKIFKDEIAHLQEGVVQDPEKWAFAQLGLKVKLKKTSTEEKNALLKIQAKAIQRNMRSQSCIMQIVNHKAKIILELVKNKYNKKNKTAYFYESIMSLIIEATRTSNDERRIKQFFALHEPNKNKTVDPILDTTENNKENSILKTTKDKIRKVAEKEIEELADSLRNHMKRANEEEIEQRGSSMKKLRKSKGLTKSELAELLDSSSITKTTIAKIETGKPMSDENALIISKALNSPKDIFMPDFFYA